MTTASKITLVRVVLIPVFMVLLLCSGGNDALRWAALGVFVVASISDFVDGYIARHYNQVTDFGKFLDPLADKLLVTACMMIFVGQGPHGQLDRVPLSSHASLQSPVCASSLSAMGASSPRPGAGKIKTSCTMVGLILMMAVTGSDTLDLVVSIVILVTTVYSGVEYFCKNWDVLNLKA